MKTLHTEISDLRFCTFSADEIRKLSVAKIVTSESFNAIGYPIPGGPYDPALGPFNSDADPCFTCTQTYHCPGHIGHIDLCMLLYNPVFLSTTYNLLRISCLSCFKLQIRDRDLFLIELQLKLIDAGYEIEAMDLEMCKVAVGRVTESEAKAINDKEIIESIDRHPQVLEYMELLEKNTSTKTITKNTESIRMSIVHSVNNNFCGGKCIHCKAEIKQIKNRYKQLTMTLTTSDLRTFYSENEETTSKSGQKSSNRAILADECRNYFRNIYKKSPTFLKLLYPVLAYCSPSLEHATDIFFTDVVLVTPPKVRPANKLRNEIQEHPQTILYKNIVTSNSVLRAVMINAKLEATSSDSESLMDSTILERSKIVYDTVTGCTSQEKLYNAWQTLQSAYNQVWDMTLGKEKHGVGLKQLIEKKEGLIRMHMMGKRVNYAARTVITPDPNINVDEIGIPDAFAKKLTFPVPVTHHNLGELRQLVVNGPNIHPGANVIEDENGQMQMIPGYDDKKRKALAGMLATDENSVKTVHRHLINGDILLMNRQPSLHRPSMMAHKARILKDEKTFRLHYSNCKSYNADFDGDEMNAHFPQNELARSEGYNIVNVSNQFLVPKDGTPLGGLIQDHIIAGVKLSLRGRFFNREDYQKLVYIGLSHLNKHIKCVPPAIIKPFRLWSGKQILSTIILNVIPDGKNPINIKSKAKIDGRAWQNAKERDWLAGGTPLDGISMSESEVIIKNGELLVGVLDKTHYGATPYGLVHCMYELYGGNCSTQLLSAFSKLFTAFMQREGFTLGVHDILVVAPADRKRHKMIKKLRQSGNDTTVQALDLPENMETMELAKAMEEANVKHPAVRALLDRKYKLILDSYTNSINKVCLPSGLLCKFPQNNLQLMVCSGAKGSTVNTMQISCLLGQIELEGKRPPLMISGKSLPSFTTFETSPKSGGFIDGRFMTGIQPQDFFFHCMAGREGLIDTAVKTSRSGYLQRCLIKHLEGLTVNYDMTVRDSDNCVVQFMYGEDGMDVAKSQFLKQQQLHFLDQNSSIIVDPDLLAMLRGDDDNLELRKHIKKLKIWIKRNGLPLMPKQRCSSFTKFSQEIVSELLVKNGNKISNGRRRLDRKIIKLWSEADVDMKKKYAKNVTCRPDPCISKFFPHRTFGSITEYLEQLTSKYIRENPDRKDSFNDLICMKSMNSMVEPGEPVGLLAAQSIGEPSTQMTLNTFHFAGRGEMNVTLGIPRLREILMMASRTIKTPSIDIPFKLHKDMDGLAERLRVKMGRVILSDVLEFINVKSELILHPNRVYAFTLKFHFLPRESYKDKCSVKPKMILKYMSSDFFKIMFGAIEKIADAKYAVVEMSDEKKEKLLDKEIDEQDVEMEKNTKKGDDDNSDDEAVDDDDDATAVKLKNRNMDEKDYDEPESDEELNDQDNDEVDDDDNGDDDGNNSDTDIHLDEIMEAGLVAKVNQAVSNYTFDNEKFLWCQITFQLDTKCKNLDLSETLRDVAKKAVIYEVPRIKRAITYQQNNELFLKTEGINMNEIFKYNQLLDLNRLYSNDIHAVANTYGIEAAARVIVKEVKNVFSVYGITVDPRHLLLIADYMTFDGTIKPLSRVGMLSSVSPLQQISFESSTQFIKTATIAGHQDTLNSPSGRIFVGQPCKSGTGACTLLTDNNYLINGFYK